MSLEGIDFLTNDFITTFAGAVIVTNIVTHFIKDYTPKWIDNKIVTLLVAMIVMLSNQFITGEITFETMYLSFLNAFIVAAAAMGNYEILNSKMIKKKMKEEIEDKTDKETS
ncbi:hypothetical protein RH915_02405 [Serpentinicella sp. ANB-PHB4]|uniref:hypothetical protein n=1 Tax=Serpentinicella sp. ANB-PHB4 TaxID=3074076 RepID=UPI002855747D|nr:hypothetical protein [Serpentinicella sp. ANB-PHB4]MDR5658334.1 hypothetical protein [Serpentinicella sp. ANB-PHB4]